MNKAHRLSERARYAIELSARETVNLNHSALDSVHLFLGLLDEKEGIAGTVLLQAGFTRAKVRAAIGKIGYVRVNAGENKAKLSASAREVIKDAAQDTIAKKHWQTTTGHLLLALLKQRTADANLRNILNLVEIPASAIATRTIQYIYACDDPLDEPLPKQYSNTIDRDRPMESFSKWVSDRLAAPAISDLFPAPEAVKADKSTLRRRIKDLSYYLQDEPTHDPFIIQRAFLQSNLGEDEAVIVGLAPLMANEPTHMTGLVIRNFAYYRQQKFEQALKDAEVLVELSPDTTYPLRRRAYALIELGESARAIADLTHALELDSSELDIYCDRAYAYLENEEFPLAHADADTRLQKDPQNFCALHYRGTARVELGDFIGAQADFKAEAPLQPDSGLPFSDMAGLQLKQGKYDSVIDFANHALEIDPKEWMALYYRGCAFAAKGMRETAISDYQKALPEFLKSKSKRSVRQAVEMRTWLKAHGISL